MPVKNDYPVQDEHYKVLFESNPFPMWFYDPESLKFLAVNDAALVKYGYSKEEFLNMSIKDIRPAQDLEPLLKNIKEETDSYQWSTGWKHVKKDGTIIDVEILSHQIIFNNRNARLVTVNDVTEKKKIENILKESEQRFRTTLDNMQEGFQILSFEWRYLYINDTAAHHGRSTRDELLNHTLIEKYPGIEETELFHVLEHCMKNRVPHSMENEFTYIDGKKRWFFLSIEPVPEGILILSTDITNEKNARMEISRLNRVYSLLSNINQAIVRIKNKQLLLDSACNIAIEYGKFKMAWIGMLNESDTIISKAASAGNVDDFLENTSKPEQQKLFWMSPAAEVIRSGKRLIFNDPDKVNNYIEPWFDQVKLLGYKSIALFPLNSFDKVIGILGLFSGEENFFEEDEISLLTEMVQDISFALETMEVERRKVQAEIELKESEKRFYSAFEYASIGMAMVSTTGMFVRVNKALCDILGYSKEELLNINIRKITHPDDIQADLEVIQQLLSKKIDTYKREKRYIHKSGYEIWVLLNSTLLRDNNDIPQYFISQIQDITDRKNAEQQILLAKEKAEDMNRLKTNFLANMSHELRTPMVGILGAAELFRESDSIDEVHGFAVIFEESAKRLVRTLNQILDISNIEAENISLHLDDIAVDEVTEKTAALFKIEAVNKKLWFDLDFLQRPIHAKLDEDILVHILNNLISNAIKYTAEGGINIIVRKKLIDNLEYAEIIIKDTGIGIPKEKYELIFEAFRQASEGFDRNHEGTGLGLTLAKKYTELMNGKISVSSELESGSTFTLRFPTVIVMKIPDKNNEITVQIIKDSEYNDKAPATPLVKALYIDDDTSAHVIVKTFLNQIAALDCCLSGEDGIKLIKQNQYDVVLIDINLGTGISGIETAAEIKTIEKYEKVPLVAITGYAMTGDKEEILNSGFNYYLSKPFSKEQFQEFIMKIAPGSQKEM